MLALAFLSVTAATEHARHPAPDGQIPLTRNEIAALFSTLIIDPVKGTGHRLRWPTWRGATSTGPKSATTSDKPVNHENHEVRLEY
jgi:hypothetical protein